MKLLHHILRGSTLATALFIFQACYGMPQVNNGRLMYEATVKVTDNDGNALKGVKVSVKNAEMAEYLSQATSDENGQLDISMIVPMSEPYLDIRFEAEGFAPKDTTIKDVQKAEPGFKIKLAAQE